MSAKNKPKRSYFTNDLNIFYYLPTSAHILHQTLEMAANCMHISLNAAEFILEEKLFLIDLNASL